MLKQTQIWPNKETLNGLGYYLRFGLPGVVMLCAEWWFFEILIFMSGLLAIEYTAA